MDNMHTDLYTWRVFPLHDVHDAMNICFQLPDPNAPQILNVHLTLHAFKKSVKTHVSPLFVV